MPDLVLDSRYQVETPEGIDLVLRPAGPMPRALAFAIDLLIRGAIISAAIYLASLLGDFGQGLLLLVLFSINWLYMLLFEVLNDGSTPGKRIIGLKVVHDDGTRIGWSSSAVRNLLRFVDALPIGYAVGLLASLVSPNFKRLGDLAAGTLVVYQDQPPPRPPIEDGPSTACPVALNQDEQRAILGFAERHKQLSAARSSEVATILAEPLHIHPAVAEDELQRIARRLLGQS